MNMEKEFTITIYTENHVGLLNRVAIIFSRRRVNIESINAGPSVTKNVHRYTVVVVVTEDMVQKLVRQVEKQIGVLKASYNTDDEMVWQEMAMYKVPTAVIAEEVKVERLLRKYGANTVVIRKDYTVFETTGHTEEIEALAEALSPFGLIEFVKSARVAISKADEGINRFLEEIDNANAPLSLIK
jgi:acetolactate synthase-1/3 small subunit